MKDAKGHGSNPRGTHQQGVDSLQPNALASAVRSVLTPDLLKPDWRAKAANPLSGHCYAASEAAYHLLGGKAAGWTPQVLGHKDFPAGLAKGETHWFLRNKDGRVLDVTGKQFAVPVPHAKARGIGFLTEKPSARAREIILRVKANED